MSQIINLIILIKIKKIIQKFVYQNLILNFCNELH